MKQRLGIQAMRTRIDKLRETVKELRAEIARLKTGYVRVIEVKEVPRAKIEKGRCECGLKLFNNKCVSCKKKNTPLSTF